MTEIYLHDIVMALMIVILVCICLLLNRRRIKLQSELLRMHSVPAPLAIRKIVEPTATKVSPVRTKKPHTNRFLDDFNQIIQTNLSNEHLNIDFIANEMSISRIQLYRKTKGLIDCTVNDYILQERLKKAKILLAESQTRITEVTFQVGFSSPAYFSAVFKARNATTPSEFRKKTISHASSRKRTYQTNCIT